VIEVLCAAETAAPILKTFSPRSSVLMGNYQTAFRTQSHAVGWLRLAAAVRIQVATVSDGGGLGRRPTAPMRILLLLASHGQEISIFCAQRSTIWCWALRRRALLFAGSHTSSRAIRFYFKTQAANCFCRFEEAALGWRAAFSAVGHAARKGGGRRTGCRESVVIIRRAAPRGLALKCICGAGVFESSGRARSRGAKGAWRGAAPQVVGRKMAAVQVIDAPRSDDAVQASLPP